MYLYRAIDSVGDTVEFFFSKSRDLPAAKHFVVWHLYGNVFVNGLFASIHGLVCVWGNCSVHDRSSSRWSITREGDTTIADADAEGMRNR
jgi:hypothetical protein